MSCEHLSDILPIQKEELRSRFSVPCGECKYTKRLWTCIQKNCNFVGCGGKIKDHITSHSKKRNHPVILNLTSFRVWCIACEEEITAQASLFSRNELKSLKADKKRAEKSFQQSSEPEKPKSVKTPTKMQADYESRIEATHCGLIGLRNMGNTCYMNSALQAISNCKPLTYYFLQEYDPGLRKDGSGVSMAENYYKFLETVWNGSYSCFSPNGVLQTLKTVNPSFRGYQQQDAQEFLRCFMDCLHEELKTVVPKWAYEDDHSESEDSHIEASDDRKEDDSLHQDGTLPLEDEPDISQESQFTMVSESQPLVPNSVPYASGASPHARTLQSSENELHGSDPSKQPPVLQSSRNNSTASKCSGNRIKKKSYRFRSVISEIFDGGLRSSVQCLTCDQVSHTKETFQDLSLPIPGKDDLTRLHTSAGYPAVSGDFAVIPGFNGPCVPDSSLSESWSSYAWSMWEWLKSWFIWPQVTLDDCLSAFFSADELKGDNMYSCNKCNKLRNGVKYCKLLELPEVLCIHLKRFRHEYQMTYSSKVSIPVSFPITGLDLSKYLAPDSPSTCTTYDLCSIIVHIGNAGGGHYVAYAKNIINQKWYEFDDISVTEVPESTITTAEAYVLFYQKSSVETNRFRDRLMEEQWNLPNDDILKFYISMHWSNKFSVYSEPGPIDNSDFVCRHSGVLMSAFQQNSDVARPISKALWEKLYNKFGGGPAITSLTICAICEQEWEEMEDRRLDEGSKFRELSIKGSCSETHKNTVYLSSEWFQEWENFLLGRLPDPPGQIDNSRICYQKDGKCILRKGSSRVPINRKAWEYLISIYDGGPEVPHPMFAQEVSPSRKSKRTAKSPGQSPMTEENCTETKKPTSNSNEALSSPASSKGLREVSPTGS